MNKYSVSLIVVAVLLLGAVLFWIPRMGGELADNGGTEESLLSVTVRAVDGDEEEILNEEVTVAAGASVLSVTQEAAEVEIHGEDAMAFVTSINGVQPEVDRREFWELIVNGAPSEMGAGMYIVSDGDDILWQMATY